MGPGILCPSLRPSAVGGHGVRAATQGAGVPGGAVRGTMAGMKLSVGSSFEKDRSAHNDGRQPGKCQQPTYPGNRPLLSERCPGLF